MRRYQHKPALNLEIPSLRQHILSNATVLKDIFGLDYDEVWTHFYQLMPKPVGFVGDMAYMVFKCAILDSHFWISPSIKSQALLPKWSHSWSHISTRFPLSQFYIHTDAHMQLLFHENGQTVYGFNSLVGSRFEPSIVYQKENSSMALKVGQKVVISLNGDGEHKTVCDESNSAKIRYCIDSYIDRNLDCVLPWRIGGSSTESKNQHFPLDNYTYTLRFSTVVLRKCDRPEDVDAYFDLTKDILSLHANIENITRITGCVPNCRMTKYYSSKSREGPYTSRDKRLYHFKFRASLIMEETTTEIEEEVYTYDMNNFVADTGGFMGLLLGFSCVDLIPILARLFQKSNL